MGAPKSSASKNPGRIRKLGNDVVKQVLYNGRGAGHGKYYAGCIGSGAPSESLIKDSKGVPLHFHEIGRLEWPQRVVAAK